MKRLVLFSVIFIAFACSKKEDTKQNSAVSKREPLKETTVGTDSDLHGCQTSAGYTWSKLKNDCVRVFEVGVMIPPVKAGTMGAFVIFDQKQAEIFVMTEPESIVLQSETNSTFSNGQWRLISSSSGKYILKKGSEILFRK